jgi:hypothetical protein
MMVQRCASKGRSNARRKRSQRLVRGHNGETRRGTGKHSSYSKNREKEDRDTGVTVGRGVIIIDARLLRCYHVDFHIAPISYSTTVRKRNASLRKERAAAGNSRY